MASSSSKYDPNVIIQSANDKLAANDVEGGQMIFQSAILDWVDDAREGAATAVVDPESLREAIATLWLSYAQYLAQAKQFRSATEAYEQAVTCPVAGEVGRVWLEYARFAEERDKLRKAQDIYLRALVGTNGQPGAVTDEQDRNLLWNEFLEMMHKTNPDLTMEELQSAAENEHDGVAIKQEGVDPDALSSGREQSKSPNLQPPTKRLKTEDSSPTPHESKTHVVTAESVEEEANAFKDILQQNQLPSDVAAAWMIRDGNAAAQPPEPPLFAPSPPKLSDPTGKDILGIDLALQLNQRLLHSSGNILLEVCRGLWTLTALKEKEAKAAIDMLDETMTKENERTEANLEARLAVAGNAASTVQQMNASERMAFQTTCSQQRQNLLSGIAWEFRQLLCVQQQILTKLDVPGFDGPTVNASALSIQSNICSYLHSAFYLRSRIGEAPHTTMLKKQAERLEKELEQHGGSQPVEPQQQQQQYGAPMLPQVGGYNYPQQQQPPPPPPQMMGMQPGYGQMMQPQPPMMQNQPPPYGSSQQQYPPYYYHHHHQ